MEEDKAIYSGIYEMLSYEDVLRHIAEHHGEEGISVVTGSDKMPAIWHEYEHLYSDTDHFHANSHKESIERIETLAALISTEESVKEMLLQKLEDNDFAEEFPGADSYIKELKQK